MPRKKRKKHKGEPQPGAAGTAAKGGRAARQGGPAPHKLPVRKKLLFSLVTLCLFFLACELMLAVCGVRPQTYTQDPFMGFSSVMPLFEEKKHGGKTYLVTRQNKVKWFNHQQFPKEKGDNTYRIFCLGGSTTYGRPYMDNLSFSAWLRELLKAADDSRDWEVVNAGGISYASYRVAALMEELNRYDPDLYIVYCGHNEFLERRTYGEMLKKPQFLIDVTATLGHTRTFTAMRRLYLWAGSKLAKPDKKSGGRAMLAGEVQAILDKSAGPGLYRRDDEFAGQVNEHYRENLERMIKIAGSGGAKLVFVSPACNLRDFSPFKSQHRDGLTRQELLRWMQLYKRGMKAYEEAGVDEAYAAGRIDELTANPGLGAALTAFDHAVAIDDRDAEVHFSRGRVLYALKRYGDAKAAFRRAVEEDVCPLRAVQEMQDTVKKVAVEKKKKVPLVDFAALAAEKSDHGIPSNKLFFDHVHPSLEGNRILSRAIMDRLVAEGIVRPGAGWNEQAVERVAAVMRRRIDDKARIMALLNLAKVLGWAGKTKASARLAAKVLELDPENPEANLILGIAELVRGNNDQAVGYFRKALRHERFRDHVGALNGLACALMRTGELDEAESKLKRALEIDPKDSRCHFGLGEVYARKTEFEDAVRCYRKALELDAEMPLCHVSLAKVLAKQGDTEEAKAHFEQALKLDRFDAGTYVLLGELLVGRGEHEGAVAQFRMALEIDQLNIDALNDLAWMLATAPAQYLRNPREAVGLAERANDGAGGKQPRLLDTLAAAYAADGRFKDAVAAAGKAVELAISAEDEELAEEINRRLELYRAGKPYLMPAPR